jgi:hypothetical protein
LVFFEVIEKGNCLYSGSLRQNQEDGEMFLTRSLSEIESENVQLKTKLMNFILSSKKRPINNPEREKNVTKEIKSRQTSRERRSRNGGIEKCG